MKRILLFFIILVLFLIVPVKYSYADACTTTKATDCTCYTCLGGDSYYPNGPDAAHTTPGCYFSLLGHVSADTRETVATCHLISGTACTQGMGCLNNACASANCSPRCTSGLTCTGSKPPVGTCICTAITPGPTPVVTAPVGSTGSTGTAGPVVGATNIATGCGSGPGEVATLDCIFPLIKNVINWALILSGSIALIFLLIGAIMFLTSGGDQKRVESAKKTMTFAILGIVLIFLSFAIINLIAYVTGVSCIKILGFQACAT